MLILVKCGKRIMVKILIKTGVIDQSWVVMLI